jgi:hypothetical protein
MVFRVNYLHMDKKKKPTSIDEDATSSEKQSNIPKMVTEVVEIIEVEERSSSDLPQDSKPEIKPEENIKTADQQTENEDEKVEKTEEGQEDEENETETGVDKPENKTEADENKPKQVVEELFSNRNSGDLMEISINRKRNSKRTLALWAIVVIVAALVIGSGLILFSKKTSGTQSAKITPTPTTIVATAPTAPPVAVDRTQITIQVLNGGGKAGAATKMKTLLTDKGYQVKDVGNTPEYTYNETQVLVKPDKAGALDLLKTDLKDSYTVGTAAATLSADSQYDAQVIVGKE